MGYNTDSQATFITISPKRKRKLLFELEKKESGKLKSFETLLEEMSP